MSRASLRRNGPRSGLSSEASARIGSGEAGWAFLDRVGEGLDREGDGDGGFLGWGEGVLEIGVGSDLWGWGSGTEIRSGAESGGVLTETKPGIFVEQEEEEGLVNCTEREKERFGFDE